jgi:Rrf2 family protein
LVSGVFIARGLAKCIGNGDLRAMLSSSRFIVAIHALSVLARSTGKGPVCSNAIAESVHTNPVVIRRLMSGLEKSMIVKSTAGRTGGFELARPAPEISLADVYCAVEDETVFRMHKMDPSSECPVAVQLKQVLMKPLRAAENAMTSALGKTSLQDVVKAFA